MIATINIEKFIKSSYVIIIIAPFHTGAYKQPLNTGETAYRLWYCSLVSSISYIDLISYRKIFQKFQYKFHKNHVYALSIDMEAINA